MASALAVEPPDLSGLKSSRYRPTQPLAVLPRVGQAHEERNPQQTISILTGSVWLDFEAACLGPTEWDLGTMDTQTLESYGTVDLLAKAAMARFRDPTGRQGPSTWEAGNYPAGQGNYPVSGVSWYEAAAYTEFAGKWLPSVYQWVHILHPIQ